jgi:hypothetical protein
MPGTRTGQPAPPRAATALNPSPRQPIGPRWSVDLHLVWDAACASGSVSGSAWSPDGDELLELPATELAGADMQDDVVAMLRALWAGRAPARTVQR